MITFFSISEDCACLPYNCLRMMLSGFFSFGILRMVIRTGRTSRASRTATDGCTRPSTAVNW
ncbi:MAG: hypothetical protein IKR50_09140 [Prevotella sp.]|nr:hypothetical protein [Prevotella sp.]